MIVPHRTPFLLPLLYPSSLVWRYPDAQRSLYLTFDDGPVPGPTEFVIETLSRYNCPATFFCIGDNVRKHDRIYKNLLSAGHATGNHTFNHVNGWRTSDEEYLANIRKCDQVVDNNKAPSKLFRPPYGRIRRTQIRRLTDYRIIMWDVLSLDYEKRLNPEKCLRNSLAATRPGSIIVFHDSQKAERNLTYALPRLIEHFLEKGFVFKKIE
jgi:peptidoglycan-N-acetylglucosamine deacetylase